MNQQHIEKQTEVLLPVEELTIHLHWDTTLDLDIFAIFETKDGEKGMIYFANSGSLEEAPFIELLFDFEFSEIPVDHQEIIAISKMDAENIWIFGWDFDAVQDEHTLNFKEQDMFLEIRCQEQQFLTSAVDLSEGNIALMGLFQKRPATSSADSEQFYFRNYSEVRTISLPEQMEDLLHILPDIFMHKM